MRKIFLAAVAVVLPVGGHAADFLKPYIMVDVGETWTRNIDGASRWDFQEGRQSPNFFGLNGRKELSAGYAAVTKLEAGYNIEETKILGHGFFGRQAYAGVETPYGTVTVGRQWELMFESLAADRWGPTLGNVPLLQLPAGPFANLGLPTGSIDFNRIAAGFSTPESVKYVSPRVDGFRVKALWGRGENNSSSSYGQTRSAAGEYSNGPLRLNVAYTNSKNSFINDGKDGIRNWGAGGLYAFGTSSVDVLYTNTRNTFTGGAVDSIMVGSLQPLSKSASVYLNYMFLKGNSALAGNQAHQAGVTVDYRINPYVDLYANAVYQRTGGASQLAYISGAPGRADGRNQGVLHVGLRVYYE